MRTTEIENILRSAPQPKPPGNLQQRLKAHALSGPRLVIQQSSVACKPGSWLGRWWPALAPAAVSLACAAGLTLQQLQINDLKAGLQVAGKLAAEAAAASDISTAKTSAGPEAGSALEQGELARLDAQAAELSGEISKLEHMRAENEKLKAQLALSSGTFTPEETEALAAARERAFRIQCANNLKQLGLAVRVWALDNGDMTPPNVLCLSNEISSFKILICPADTGRQPAKDPASFTPANCSYEFLAPSGPASQEPQRVLFKCPIHGNIGLCDGSVQSGIAKEHPDWIEQRDGKYFLKRIDPPADTSTPGPPGQGQ